MSVRVKITNISQICSSSDENFPSSSRNDDEMNNLSQVRERLRELATLLHQSGHLSEKAQ